VTAIRRSGHASLRRYFLILAGGIGYLKYTILPFAASTQFAARIRANEVKGQDDSNVGVADGQAWLGAYSWRGLYGGHKFWGRIDPSPPLAVRAWQVRLMCRKRCNCDESHLEAILNSVA